MPAPAVPEIYELEPHPWAVEADGSKQEYVTEFSTNYQELGLNKDDRVPSLVLVGGYGELGGSLDSALAFLAQQGIAAVAPRVRPGDIPGERIKTEGFVRGFGREAIGAAQDQTNPDEKAVVIGHSMGGAFTGITLEEAPGLIGDMGLAEPAAATTWALRERYPNATRAEIASIARLAKIAFNPLYKDSFADKAVAAWEIGRQLKNDLVCWPPGKVMWEKFSLLPNNDIMPVTLDHAADGHNVVLGLGANDPLVIPKEVVQSILGHIDADPDRYTPEAIAGIFHNLHFILNQKGGHMHLASDAAQENLAQMAELIVPDNMRHEPAPARSNLSKRLFKLVMNQFSMDEWFENVDDASARAA